MSVESMSVALRLQGLPPAEKLLLVGIANHDGDGGAWPSVATLATYVGVTARQVQKLLRKLEERGLLSIEVQAGGTTKTRSDQRPNLYHLHLERGVAQDTPRGVPQDTPPVSPRTPEPSFNRQQEEDTCSSGDERPPTAPPGDRLFEQNLDDFWSMYPRRVGKPAAKKALRAALRKDAAAVIATGLAAWIEFWRASDTEPGFIPYPATWLNQERWNDTPPPLPDKPPAPSRADDVSINFVLEQATPFFVGRDLLQWRHEHILQLRATIRTMHNWGFELGETMIRIGIAARRPSDMIEPSKLAKLPRVARFPGMPPGDIAEAMETAYRNLAWRAS